MPQDVRHKFSTCTDGMMIYLCILHACGQTTEKQVVFNDDLRILLRILSYSPRWNSASEIFVVAGVSTF